MRKDRKGRPTANQRFCKLRHFTILGNHHKFPRAPSIPQSDGSQSGYAPPEPVLKQPAQSKVFDRKSERRHRATAKWPHNHRAIQGSNTHRKPESRERGMMNDIEPCPVFELRGVFAGTPLPEDVVETDAQLTSPSLYPQEERGQVNRLKMDLVAWRQRAKSRFKGRDIVGPRQHPAVCEFQSCAD
jgi:hypothetical protein